MDNHMSVPRSYAAAAASRPARPTVAPSTTPPQTGPVAPPPVPIRGTQAASSGTIVGPGSLSEEPLQLTARPQVPRTGVIYNDCYGYFGFSDEFEEELSRRVSPAAPPTLSGHISVRTHPAVLALLKEWGKKRSSAEGACLRIQSVPSMFLPKFIDILDYDEGKEMVFINTNRAIAAATRAFLVHRNVDTLVNAVKDIDEAEPNH